MNFSYQFLSNSIQSTAKTLKIVYSIIKRWWLTLLWFFLIIEVFLVGRAFFYQASMKCVNIKNVSMSVFLCLSSIPALFIAWSPRKSSIFGAEKQVFQALYGSVFLCPFLFLSVCFKAGGVVIFREVVGGGRAFNKIEGGGFFPIFLYRHSLFCTCRSNELISSSSLLNTSRASKWGLCSRFWVWYLRSNFCW